MTIFKYLLIALYIDIILAYICFNLLKYWFGTYSKFNNMIKKGYSNDIDDNKSKDMELFNIGYWNDISYDIMPYYNASVNLETYILSKINIVNSNDIGNDRILIINPSAHMINNPILQKSYFLFTSIDRYELSISDIEQNNVSALILNPNGTIPYVDGCIDKILNIETNIVCEREKLIKECYRILKPKTGTFIFSTIDVSNKFKAYPISCMYDIPVNNIVSIEKTLDKICENTIDLTYNVEDITEYSLLSLLNFFYNMSDIGRKVNMVDYIQKIVDAKYFIIMCKKID